MDVLSLLKSKNRCLTKFHQASVEFLSEADVLRSSEQIPSLPEFEAQRESILKAISLFDRKITEAVSSITIADRTPELVRAVEDALIQKDQILAAIVKTDEQVLKLVEEEKNRVGRELAATQKSRSMVQKFKSSWVAEAGEEIDQKL